MNQVNGTPSRVELPKMTMGGVALGSEISGSKSLPVVDKVREITGSSAALFSSG